MVELVRSRPVLVLATIAAALWSLALVLEGIAHLTYSESSALSTFANLITATTWLFFAAAFGVLSACCYCTWFFFVRQRFSIALELASLALASLLFTIGFLIQAAASVHSSDAGAIVSAVGLGGWAVVLVVQAARHSIQEQQDPSAPREAGILMGGAGAVVVLAVALGLPAPTLSDTALAVATEVILGLGWLSLAAVLYAAREGRFLSSPQIVTVIAGLLVLFASAVVLAVTDGIVYGPPPTSLSGFRLISIGIFIGAVGGVILAVAAVRRMGEIPAVAIPTGALQSSWYSPPSPEIGQVTASPGWQPDPSGRHEARWWDGTHWTEHVTDGGRPGLDPLP